MKLSKVFVALLALGFVAVSAPAQDAEKALRDLDAKFAEAAAAKDVDKLVAFYAADATVLPPNEPAATTKEDIRKHWKASLETAGLSLSWKPTKVEVSGDMGYTAGNYEVKSGGKQVDQGKYVSIWKKQADGTWKSVVDIWNSDLAAAAAQSADKKE